MVIEKVLNNNVAVTRGDSGAQTVVMGRGLAFGCKAGDRVDPALVEKTYSLMDSAISEKFQRLLANIPMAHMLLSERVIEYARQMGLTLGESIYVTLPDHISVAIARYREALMIENPLKWDIKRFYPDEFKVGRYAAELVREETGVQFTDDEAAFIAMHFVNAQLGGGRPSGVYDVTRIVGEITAIVRDCFDALDEDCPAFLRFAAHLRFLARRILENAPADEGDDDLLAPLAQRHALAYECACRIGTHITGVYQYACGEGELLCLTVHLARLLK